MPRLRGGTVPRVTDFAHIRADNPGPFTLTGTNTYVVEGWIIDPGPSLPEHMDAIVAAAPDAQGIVLTHDHSDHVAAVAEIAGRLGVQTIGAARYAGRTLDLADGDTVGPFTVHATPGHAPDHLTFVAGGVAFTGDAVLGTGSVFVWPEPSTALIDYLAGLRRLRALPLTTIGPGHGPIVDDPQAKLDEYIAHRAEREARLVAALDSGKRSADDLLDDAWSDAPAHLRAPAMVTMRAHLDKLREEGRLPDGVELPALPDWGRRA